MCPIKTESLAARISLLLSNIRSDSFEYFLVTQRCRFVRSQDMKGHDAERPRLERTFIASPIAITIHGQRTPVPDQSGEKGQFVFSEDSIVGDIRRIER
jgi:hypothetical protein